MTALAPAPDIFAKAAKASLNYWTAKDDERLKKLWRIGLSASEIGDELKRTRSAVMGRVHRLSLPARRLAAWCTPDISENLSRRQRLLYRKLRSCGLSAEEAMKEARK